MILLAVDPSVRSSGIALFKDGILIHAARVTVKPNKHSCGAQRCMDMVWAIEEKVTKVKNSIHLNQRVTTVVFEWPRTYPNQKTPPNDLFPLAGIGMALYGLHSDGAEVHSYLPQEWSGGVPKSKTGSALVSARGKRISGILCAEEKALVPDQHDILDAVGLGLFHLGRMERKRVFPGAK